MLHIIAGKGSAFETKFRLSFSKNFTGFDLASDAGHWLISVRSSAAGAFVLFS